MTHFAYSSWTGDSSADVPSQSHGLLDLVEHALAHKAEAQLPGPIAVHCRCGSDRSSVYVALSCLVQQVKNEARADVFTVVRKLRSQRQGMVQHVVSRIDLKSSKQAFNFILFFRINTNLFTRQ